MSALSSQQFGERPTGKHCLAYLRPVAANGEGLFVKPDVSGESGVHVHDYDQLRQVIKGKTAHRYDYDNDEFKRAKVHHWDHSDAMPDGSHRSTWQYPAGGTLADATRTT
jgi:hypothetical protein